MKGRKQVKKGFLRPEATKTWIVFGRENVPEKNTFKSTFERSYNTGEIFQPQ